MHMSGYNTYVFVECAQNGTLQIDTNDENAHEVFTESVFCVSIQIVPETLPIPIPTTVPKTIPIYGHRIL